MELYNRKGAGWLPVLTGSMLPLLHPGDQVLIAATRAEHIRPGDIIVFRRNSELYVHRVLKKQRTPGGLRFVEKGDATHQCGFVDADAVIGRVNIIKDGHRMFALTSPASKFTRLIMSVWFYGTAITINLLTSSVSRNMRRAGRVLSPISLWSSNILARICRMVWYLPGLSNPR
jgi:signal peptidase I